MMDRWRSLFLCAGVNSGREAALSTAADRNIRRKKKNHKGENIPEQRVSVTLLRVRQSHVIVALLITLKSNITLRQAGECGAV